VRARLRLAVPVMLAGLALGGAPSPAVATPALASAALPKPAVAAYVGSAVRVFGIDGSLRATRGVVSAQLCRSSVACQSDRERVRLLEADAEL
jgi:hypothetical protein